MSYILDALKRADAERERGAVPGLHARQLTTPALPADHRTRYRIALAAAALGLGGIAAGLWVWKMPAAGTGRLAALEPAVVPAPAPVPSAQPVSPAPLPAAVPPSVPLPRAAALPPVERSTVSRPVSKPARPAASAAMPALPTPRLDPVAKAAATPAQAAPVAVPLLSELPESIRRQIPALAITGSVYSANPAQRLLLVNNQVLTQGSLVAPGVSLEEVRAKSSVFSFQGTRFQVPH